MKGAHFLFAPPKVIQDQHRRKVSRNRGFSYIWRQLVVTMGCEEQSRTHVGMETGEIP